MDFFTTLKIGLLDPLYNMVYFLNSFSITTTTNNSSNSSSSGTASNSKEGTPAPETPAVPTQTPLKPTVVGKRTGPDNITHAPIFENQPRSSFKAKESSGKELGSKLLCQGRLEGREVLGRN